MHLVCSISITLKYKSSIVRRNLVVPHPYMDWIVSRCRLVAIAVSTSFESLTAKTAIRWLFFCGLRAQNAFPVLSLEPSIIDDAVEAVKAALQRCQPDVGGYRACVERSRAAHQEDQHPSSCELATACISAQWPTRIRFGGSCACALWPRHQFEEG